MGFYILLDMVHLPSDMIIQLTATLAHLSQLNTSTPGIH